VERGFNEFKKRHVERREALVLLINDLGFFMARRLYKTLAEKYKVSTMMIYKDFNWIKGNMKPEDLREVKMDLRIGRSKAYSAALDLLLNAKDSEEKAKAINTLIAAGKHYREELEAWGEKEKVADRHDLSMSVPMIFNLVEKSVEEIKDGKKGDKSVDKSEAGGNPEGSE
jgi:hypothetical protein